MTERSAGMQRLVSASWLLLGIGAGCIPENARLSTLPRTRPVRQALTKSRPAATKPTSPSWSSIAAGLSSNRQRISPRWTHIVIHHSATTNGGAKRFDKFHRKANGWDELGYHFVIGNGTDTPDGYVEVGPRWRKQKHGAHCKTPDNYYNEHGIGICLVGDFTRTKPSRNQLASLERLVRSLSSKCGIPPWRVTTHRAITHKTQCPGDHLPIARLRRALTRSTAAAVMP